MAPTAVADRYTIISADTHGGGNMAAYREHLDPDWRDEFDAWRGDYKNPFRDLQGDGRSRNWDSDRRLAEQEADGVVAEVVFPNTVPPFFPTGALVARPPTPEEFPRRLAGIRAHNRWMAEWCAEQPVRRAGMAQIFLNDLDEAIADVRFAAEHGLRGGVLLPAVPPTPPTSTRSTPSPTTRSGRRARSWAWSSTTTRAAARRTTAVTGRPAWCGSPRRPSSPDGP